MNALDACGPAAPRRTIGRYDRILIAGIEYRGDSSDDIGHVFVRMDSEIPENFTHDQYALVRKEVGFRFDRGWFDPGKVVARRLAGIERLSHLPPHERPYLAYRYEWCRTVLRAEAEGKGSRSDLGLKTIIRDNVERIAMMDIAGTGPTKTGRRAGRQRVVRDAPGPKALLDWVCRLEEGGMDPLALRNRTYRSGNRQRQLKPEVVMLIQSIACKYASRTRPQKQRLYEDLQIAVAAINADRVAKGLATVDCPSRKALSKAIARLDVFEVYAGRHGLDAARRRFQTVTTGVTATRPFERIEIDEWTVSLQTLAVEAGVWERMGPDMRKTVERLRYALCVAIDVASRCVVGASIRPKACVENALATLRMAVSDKTPFAMAARAVTPWDMYGGLELVVTDSGPSFVSGTFQSAVVELGGTPELPPAGIAHLRGTVERSFYSLRTRLATRFTGQTFANVMEKGDYDPVSDASLTVEEWSEVLVRHWVDHYHNWPHSGLGGQTPRARWLELERLYGTTEAPDAHTLRETFGIPLKRTVGGHGVRVLGLRFNAERLQRFFRRAGPVDVAVRVDPWDLGYVSVFVEGGWLTLRCHRQGFDGVRVDVWIRATEDLRRRYADQTRIVLPVALDAIRDIQAISDAAVARAGLAALVPTAEQIDRIEHAVGLGFELPEVVDTILPVDGGDPLFGGFKTGGTSPETQPRTSLASPQADAGSASRARRFRMTD